MKKERRRKNYFIDRYRMMSEFRNKWEENKSPANDRGEVRSSTCLSTVTVGINLLKEHSDRVRIYMLCHTHVFKQAAKPKLELSQTWFFVPCQLSFLRFLSKRDRVWAFTYLHEAESPPSISDKDLTGKRFPCGKQGNIQWTRDTKACYTLLSDYSRLLRQVANSFPQEN